MTIDWTALGLVSLVSLVATVAVVTVATLGIAAIGTAQDRVKVGRAAVGIRLTGYLCLALAAAAVLFGIYLIIPAFH